MFSDTTEELAQNKLLLLYIIKLSSSEFTKTELTNFILEKDLLNYFSIQQYLGELVEAQFLEAIEEDKEVRYNILEKGESALYYFSSKIPKDIRESLKEDFKVQEIEKQKETQVIGEYYEKDNGQYMVNLRLVENGEVLYSLYLNVASMEQAQLICKSWKERTDKIYIDTINMLVQV